MTMNNWEAAIIVIFGLMLIGMSAYLSYKQEALDIANAKLEECHMNAADSIDFKVVQTDNETWLYWKRMKVESITAEKAEGK